MAQTEGSGYKDTVNLPTTDFPMKGNLAQTEPVAIDTWIKNKIHQKMAAGQVKGPRYTMPDGPPYANGNIHLGHVLNKVLKDIVIKSRNMLGDRGSFIPGWDCHGLPIELNVTKKLGAKRKEVSDTDFRKMCREEAQKWIDTQKAQFIRLGILADWDHPYLTMHPAYEAEEIRVFARIFENGILYRGEKPVYWSPALQTALAAAEVEYHDHKSLSIFVKFYLESGLEKLNSPQKPVAFVIWTTTPWTLPANYGIALNADYEYGLFDTGKEILILAKDLKESVEKASGLTLTLTKTFKGKHFEGLKAKHPFMPRESLVVLGEHVTLDAGTGAVHTAPGHGMEDYVVGLKYKLPVHSPVDPGGRYTADVPQYQGEKIWDANPKIVEALKQSGHLLAVSELVHSYPHDPRSKTPLIFRATPQWFIRMDDEKFNLRKKALTACEKDIRFVPEWGIQRLIGMLTSTPDWCLSRQRTWGVPIPVFYCTKCGEPLAKVSVMNKVADAIEKHPLGIEAYHSDPIENFTHGEKCGQCSNTEFQRGRDILDVWFDSGVCHSAVQKKRDELQFPADIYLEGSDQHRGWFQTSLLSSLAAYDTPPFKALVTHGFVNDSEGYKMSKSKGNVLDPAEVINKYGAEILRLWVTYEDYGQDVTVGNEMFLRVTETYRRIRNTMRFLLGNIGDFNPEKDRVEYGQMTPLDQWAVSRLHKLVFDCRQAYSNYDFYKVYHALNNFFTVDLSATYLDILKDRLYTGKKTGVKRRASQTVLYDTLTGIASLMAPILSFLAEETYRYIPGKKQESVFLTQFPPADEKLMKSDEAFSEVLVVRSETAKVLEELRQNKEIGSSLDAQVEVSAQGKRLDALKKFEKDLREIFIVSKVTLKEGANQIKASKADGLKCVRCWHYNVDVGRHSEHKEICGKCVEALT